MRWLAAPLVLLLLVGCTRTRTQPEFQVTYGGGGCMYEGPERVVSDDYRFLFVNETDEEAGMAILRLGEGRTPEDFTTYVDENPGMEPPPWVSVVGSVVRPGAGRSGPRLLVGEGSFVVTCLLPGEDRVVPAGSFEVTPR